MDERFPEDVFSFIRRGIVRKPGKGSVSREEVHAHFGPSDETEAALAVLLLEKRIVAYQRSESWTYALPGGGRSVDHETALRYLRESGNIPLHDHARADETVMDAVLDYFRRNPPRERVEAMAYHDDSGVTHVPGRSIAEVDFLDVEHDINGGIRVIRAR